MKVAVYEKKVSILPEFERHIYSIYIFKLLVVTGVKHMRIRARVQYVHIVNVRKSIFK